MSEKKNNLDLFQSLVVFEILTGHWNRPKYLQEILYVPTKVWKTLK